MTKTFTNKNKKLLQNLDPLVESFNSGGHVILTIVEGEFKSNL